MKFKFKFKSILAPAHIPPEDWNSWHWQMQNSLKTFSLKDSPLNFQARCTPYYLEVTKNSSLEKIHLPSPQEFLEFPGDHYDPLGEQKNSPVPRIIHRYSDRVLFLVTDTCSVYCRFCTRKHFTGQDHAFMNTDEYEKALNYIKTKTHIREVILSGGDPLTLSNIKIEKILSDIHQISHVEIIRIATRMPVVCPMRIDVDLLKILKKYKPIFLMTHFNHPDEITTASADALESFVDHGVPVFNQMVLLNGINNHPALVQALSRRLLYLRVKPYYMFQMDPSSGSHHFINTVENSLEIQKELWGHLSGLAMPQLSLDVPGIGGKTPLVPQFEINKTTTPEGAVMSTYTTFDGKVGHYHSPTPQELKLPDVHPHYAEEWELLSNYSNTKK